ncbi:MAG TPA: hypothetical protein VGN97_19310 [Mesorhizobium sp.]|jgi:hypothetical protein|nr:hypothetical protein [Mesorhizobium sp.]
MTTDTDDPRAAAKPDLHERLARWRAIADAGQPARVTSTELGALLDAFEAERAAREAAERNAALFGDQSDRFEGLYLAERKRGEAALRRERDARALLGQAGLQIRSLHERFGETSSGNAVLSRIRRFADGQ